MFCTYTLKLKTLMQSYCSIGMFCHFMFCFPSSGEESSKIHQEVVRSGQGTKTGQGHTCSGIAQPLNGLLYILVRDRYRILSIYIAINNGCFGCSIFYPIIITEPLQYSMWFIILRKLESIPLCCDILYIGVVILESTSNAALFFLSIVDLWGAISRGRGMQ